jgi:hypothetical protein
VTRAEGIAKLLAEHMPTAATGYSNRGEGGGTNYRYCKCEWRAEVTYAEMGDSHDSKPFLDAKLAAHQAAVVDAWLAGQEHEEWGVRFERDAGPTMDNPSGEVTNTQVVNDESDARNAVARKVPISARNRRVVRRRVGEWEDA